MAELDARLQKEIAETDRVLAELKALKVEGNQQRATPLQLSTGSKGSLAGADSRPKSDPLLDELLALDRHNPVGLAALEARLEARFQKESAEWDARKAEIERQYAVPVRPPMRGWDYVVAGLFLYAFIGVVLELSIGGGFVFAFTGQHRTAMPWIELGVAVLWAGNVALRSGVRERMRHSYPGRLKRWLMFPMVTATFSALCGFATPGWAALLGWMAGGPVSEWEARIVTVDTPSTSSRSLTCKQYVKVFVNGSVVGLCAAGRMAAPAPVEGEPVLLVGPRSWFGMSVHEIRRR